MYVASSNIKDGVEAGVYVQYARTTSTAIFERCEFSEQLQGFHAGSVNLELQVGTRSQQKGRAQAPGGVGGRVGMGVNSLPEG